MAKDEKNRNEKTKKVKVDRATARAERQTKKQKRKNAQIANTNKKKKDDEKKRGGLREYFKGVKVETKKVVWPTRKELVSYTIVVIFACAFFSVSIWGVDSGFLALLKLLFNIDLG